MIINFKVTYYIQVVTVTPSRNVPSKPRELGHQSRSANEDQELKLEVQKKSGFVEVPRLRSKASLAMARNGFMGNKFVLTQNNQISAIANILKLMTYYMVNLNFVG